MANSESPEFIGLTIALLVVAQLVLGYDYTDIDSKQPRPVTVTEV